MSILAYLIGAGFLVWAASPLLKKDVTWISLIMDHEELEDKKKRVYGNIADLEFDYAMGRLSEKDFTVIRESFMKEAGRVIQMIEEQDLPELTQRIQNDVQNSKKSHTTTVDAKTTCAKCGSENVNEAKFCMSCGEPLS